MKAILAAISLSLFAVVPALALEPIEGSVANGRVKLAPIGSPFFHHFTQGGNEYRETYIVAPDKSLKLVDRVEMNND